MSILNTLRSRCANLSRRSLFLTSLALAGLFAVSVWTFLVNEESQELAAGSSVNRTSSRDSNALRTSFKTSDLMKRPSFTKSKSPTISFSKWRAAKLQDYKTAREEYMDKLKEDYGAETSVAMFTTADESHRRLDDGRGREIEPKEHTEIDMKAPRISRGRTAWKSVGNSRDRFVRAIQIKLLRTWMRDAGQLDGEPETFVWAVSLS
jgi:hypothetical protein